MYINNSSHMTKMAAMPIYLMILKKIGPPGAHILPPWGNIHVYLHNIQISSSLKPLSQSKPNFI